MHALSEPFERFAKIFAEARAVQPKDANQLWLATVGETGFPEVRVVLLKDFDTQGFVFFTNHTSRKGRALIAEQKAGMNFYWPALDQQVRCEGTVSQVTAAESDAYFATRARLSQLGAWASHQSQPLKSREELEARLADIDRTYPTTVPRPPHWGGFRLAPVRMEFWKAHPNRLHWREEYVREASGWRHQWLNP